MDLLEPCPLGGSNVGNGMMFVLLGLCMLVLYGVVPYLIILVQLCRRQQQRFSKNQHNITHVSESLTAYTLYGWASEGYKPRAYFWEPINALVIVLTVVASKAFRGEERMLMHAAIAGTSMVVHTLVRPYEDVAGNVVVVLFASCEMLGALGEMVVPWIDQEMVQWMHVIVLLIDIDSINLVALLIFLTIY